MASAGRGQRARLRRGRNFVDSSTPRGSTEPASGGRVFQPGLTVADFFANGRKRLTDQIFPLHWRGFSAGVSSPRRPMPHTGSRGLAFGQPFIASAQKEMFHAGALREFGVSARLHGILLLSVPSSGVKVVHASTDAYVCAWIRRQHDELYCAMVFEKPGLCGHHKLLRSRIYRR